MASPQVDDQVRRQQQPLTSDRGTKRVLFVVGDLGLYAPRYRSQLISDSAGSVPTCLSRMMMLARQLGSEGLLLNTVLGLLYVLYIN